jgi:hypothetical protein
MAIWRSAQGDAIGQDKGSLYPSLIQRNWVDLDDFVRDFHSRPRRAQARGRLTVRRGRGLMARLAAAVLRLPRAGDSVPTLLVVEPGRPLRSGRLGQTWTRTFGERTLSSRQYAAPGGLLAERFRLVELRFRLHVHTGALRFEQTGASFALGSLRIAIPRRLWPRIQACVRAALPHGDEMEVRVTLSMPIIGLVLMYAGCMRPEAARP